EAKIDLAKVKWEDALLGLNVVCDCDSTPGGQIGKVWECRADGKPRWQIENLKNPSDYQLLPGGRVLIAEFQANQVSERDKTGKVLWSKQVNTFPTTCLRLPNGNTFIGTYNEILEVTPDGKTVFTHRSNGGSIYRAKKLGSGHILYICSNNQIIELDAAGKQVRTIPVQNTGVFSSVEVLPGGHYLVGLYSANKVIEVDVDGKVHWQCEVQTPSSVSRLPNGNILVSSMDAKAIVEIDRGSKVVWKQTTQGRPFLVRRY